MASDNIGINAEKIELTLAHQEPNAIRRTYNHAKLIPERRALMEQWADALDEYRLVARSYQLGWRPCDGGFQLILNFAMRHTGGISISSL